MKELYDLFGSGNDAAIRELEREFAAKERRWKENVRDRLKSILMPNSYRRSIEAIEYGFSGLDGVIYPPTPFMRTTGKRNRLRWRNKLAVAAARFALEDDEDELDELELDIRKELYESAVRYGVPDDVAEVFKMRFKKNYRKVQMVEWVHGDSETPREYHERKWDGRTGKVNGKPNGLDGYVFPIDKPPVIDKDEHGRDIRGFPGDLPNCSCLLVPVFE